MSSGKLLGIGALCVAISMRAEAAAPRFQDLMSPACLPSAQFGMRVENAAVAGGQLHVTTAGAELALDVTTGKGALRQRIGHSREVVDFEIAGGLGTAELTHSGPGFARAKFSAPRCDMRINGDSLLMLHAHEPMQVKVSSRIPPAFFASHKSSHVVFDEWGGFGLYCSVPEINDHFDVYEATIARYDLPADAVLWIAVCPPKPYDWRRSCADQVIWHWSNALAYPADDTLNAWQPFGNIVLLQSEVMLWKDWNLGFEPRLGPGEFARVRETLHRLGMRFIVYTSPFYFLRGTDKQASAMNSFEHFTNWPPGTPTGENIDLFLAEIDKVMREYRPDGLYFDGQYSENPAALYLLARRAREIVGDDGLLEWHSTNALGADLCSLPTADAYVDFILRGEGCESRYGDDNYLRYFVSGYNVHNSVGVLCNNGSRPTHELADRLVAVNGRMHTMAGWLRDPQLVALAADYREQLSDPKRLQARVDNVIAGRQSRVQGEVAMAEAEDRALKQPPVWSQVAMTNMWQSVDGWQQCSSPLNPEAITPADDGLHIRARASTFAYVERPLHEAAGGFEARIRRGTDRGASWGPAVALEWSDEIFLRVGLRADGLLEVNMGREQRLLTLPKVDDWLWLRVRWLKRRGLLECSTDGRSFSPLCRFDNRGRYDLPVHRVIAGKVPYNLRPEDFTEPGDTGECVIGPLVVYGPSVQPTATSQPGR